MYFYKDLFASLCFILFGAALAFGHPMLYLGAMMCGALSMTAKRKMWEDPLWAKIYIERFHDWVENLPMKTPKQEFKDGEEIKPLPPLDEKL